MLTQTAISKGNMIGETKSVTVLFIGNFYKEHKGSHNIGSKVIDKISRKDILTKKIVLPGNPYGRLFILAYRLLIDTFDIVHLEVYSGRYFRFMLPVVMPLVAWRKKKVIFNLAGGSLPEFYLGNESEVKKFLLKADVLVSPSKRIISFFAERVPALSIQYLPNFIDIMKFPYRYKEAMTFKVLWVRAFDVTYNPQHAIEALKALEKQFTEVRLTMVGPDKGLLAECKKLVDTLALNDKVTFAGVVDNTKLFQYFHSHDVFINTTSFESFGFALAEAAASGIPIVSYSVGEIPFLWQDHYDILLCKSSDPETLAKEVTVLFNDPQLRKRLSSNARQNAERFSWDCFSVDFFDIVDKLSL